MISYWSVTGWLTNNMNTLLTSRSSGQDGEELPHRVIIIFIINPTVKIFLAELIDLHM